MKATILTSLLACIIGLGQTLMKCWVGSFAYSHVLFADGLHALSDMVLDLLILVMAWYASFPPDRDYPYGRGRYEAVAVFLISIALLWVSWELVGDAMWSAYPMQATHHAWVIGVSLLSSLISFGLYLWMRHQARMHANDLIASNAVHQLSHIPSSLVVSLSGLGTAWGLPWSDALGTMVVVALIAGSMLPFLRRSLLELTDHAMDAQTQKELENFLLSDPHVVDVHDVRTRYSAGRCFVDAHITLDALLSFTESHVMIEALGEKLKHRYPQIGDVLLHADPKDYGTHAWPLRSDLRLRWQALEIPLEVMNPCDLQMYYHAEGIHIDWRMHPGYALTDYRVWREKILLMPEIVEVRLWQEVQI